MFTKGIFCKRNIENGKQYRFDFEQKLSQKTLVYT